MCETLREQTIFTNSKHSLIATFRFLENDEKQSDLLLVKDLSQLSDECSLSEGIRSQIVVRWFQFRFWGL